MMRRPSRRTVSAIEIVGTVALVAAASACSHFVDAPPPSNILDPSSVETPQAAISMYQGAVYQMSQAFAGGFTSYSYAAISGLFSDEFTGGSSTALVQYDAHFVTPQNETDGPFNHLNTARSEMDAAILGLTTYGGSPPPSYVAEMHALKGYVYLLTSELYCSGVPFSYFAANGDAVYGKTETTIEMVNDAIAQFDSATALAADSTRILQLAAVGRARALLDTGDYAGAQAAVASVPTSFAYQFTYSASINSYWNYLGQLNAIFTPPFYMADVEGGNGLNYISAFDPRTTTYLSGGKPLPVKFQTADKPVSLADGVEARLIEAEAALQAHDVAGWAGILNTLRTNGSFTTKDTVVGTLPDTMTVQDTLWAAGTGNVAGLGPLPLNQTINAPNDSIRVNVLFRERAFWLFGTGHRAGDMRRLIRQYQRSPTMTWPAGATTYSSSPLPYTPDSNLPIPAAENNNNPGYGGCINRDA
jgi:hypothetical protein